MLTILLFTFFLFEFSQCCFHLGYGTMKLLLLSLQNCFGSFSRSIIIPVGLRKMQVELRSLFIESLQKFPEGFFLFHTPFRILKTNFEPRGSISICRSGVFFQKFLYFLCIYGNIMRPDHGSSRSFVSRQNHGNRT